MYFDYISKMFIHNEIIISGDENGEGVAKKPVP